LDDLSKKKVFYFWRSIALYHKGCVASEERNCRLESHGFKKRLERMLLHNLVWSICIVAFYDENGWFVLCFIHERKIADAPENATKKSFFAEKKLSENCIFFLTVTGGGGAAPRNSLIFKRL
jgi:hypothetical protein